MNLIYPIPSLQSQAGLPEMGNLRVASIRDFMIEPILFPIMGS